jgi:hypothetical protein
MNDSIPRDIALYPCCWSASERIHARNDGIKLRVAV